MADPSFANDIPEAAPLVAEPEDWAGDNTRKTFRLLALFILPSIFLLLCAIALVLFLMPRIKAGHLTAAAPVATVATSAPADKDAEINALQGQIANLQNQLLTHQSAPATAALPGGAAVTGPILAADSAALTQLSARLDRVEANQRALVHAASAAAAADALQGAADSGAPFSTELALVQSQLANPHLLDPVRPFAEHGLPSRVALATQFPHVAATANIAAKAANGDKGPLAQLRHSLGAFISVRRTDTSANGVGVEATLAHAEAHIDAGDLAGAVGYLNGLPLPAQTAIKPWLDQARARVALDAATRRISEQALGSLGQSSTDSAAGGAL